MDGKVIRIIILGTADDGTATRKEKRKENKTK